MSRVGELTLRACTGSFYWEICPKLDENGKLKQEMILVW